MFLLRKIIKGYLVVLLGGILTVIGFSFSFAEDKHSAPKQEIDSIRESLKSTKLVAYLMAYKAVRTDNMDACNVGDDYNCLDLYNDIIIVKYMAKGKCEYFEDDEGRYNLCKALSGNRCNSLEKSYNRMICKGVVENNIELLMRGFNNPAGASRYGITPRKKAIWQLNLYRGFKRGRYTPGKYSQETPFIYNVSYNLLFDRSINIDDAIDSLLTDFAYFVYAKQKNEDRVCYGISNYYIKKACLNDDIDSLQYFIEGRK